MIENGAIRINHPLHLIKRNNGTYIKITYNTLPPLFILYLSRAAKIKNHEN